MDEPILTDAEFRKFRELIYKYTGISLADIKRQMVQSRLRKRLKANDLNCFQDYYNLVASLNKNDAEMTDFINCVTTNKTDFFREPHHFKFITEKFLPEKIRLAERGESPRTLRIWHAGCSTGEEPYTLAMTLAEGLARHGKWDVRQLASDIDTNVLGHAQEGIYELERVAPVPPALLNKYFLRGKGASADYVRVSRQLRDMITFRQINLLDEPWPIRPEARFDIIFCRNVVIYFDKPTQKKLFARYAEKLKPGGYLFIGHSESLLGISDAFESLGGTIYRLSQGQPLRHSLTELIGSAT